MDESISSMGGFLPVPGQGIYGASKSAIKLFMKALYAELSETGVQIFVLFSGRVWTGVIDQLGADILSI